MIRRGGAFVTLLGNTAGFLGLPQRDLRPIKVTMRVRGVFTRTERGLQSKLATGLP